MLLMHSFSNISEINVTSVLSTMVHKSLNLTESSLIKIKEYFAKMMNKVEDDNALTMSKTETSVIGDNFSTPVRDKATYGY